MVYWETRPDFEERCGEVHTSLEIVLCTPPLKCFAPLKGRTPPLGKFINTLTHMYSTCIRHVVDFMFDGGRELDHCTSPTFFHTSLTISTKIQPCWEIPHYVLHGNSGVTLLF